MKFLGIDTSLEGLKRGAEKFGSKVADKIVKKFEHRNGLVPEKPEPYGAGEGGADTEQESQTPTQALNGLGKCPECDGEVKKKPNSGDPVEYECTKCGQTLGAEELKNESEANLGFQSTEKTTTAKREEYENALTHEAAVNVLKNMKNKVATPLALYNQAMFTLGMVPNAAKWKDAIIVNEAPVDTGSKTITKDDLKKQTEDYPHDAGKDGRKDDRAIEEAQNSDDACSKCGAELTSRESASSQGQKLMCDKCQFKTKENAGDAINCSACDKAISGKDIKSHNGQAMCDSCLKEVKTYANAGHLTPEAWMAAATEERAVWLELADQDINLATHDWTNLSLDTHKKLQDVYDLPKSINNDSGECKSCGADLEEGLGRHGLCESCSATHDNAAGKMPTYVFEDGNGEKEQVLATSEQEAWDKLSHDYGTSLQDLKGMLKMVKVIGNEKENGDSSGDLSEIAHHAEGIEHEVKELSEEGLESSKENKAGDRLSGADCTCGHAGSQHHDTGHGEACQSCNCEVYDPAVTCRKCGQKERQGMAVGGLCEECQNSKEAPLNNSGVTRGSLKYGSK